ncbi:SDR family oxidoreductase [Brooklawnia cerclae]|uniref:Dihydroflavonol-4-reductase n=1 Tax=Brooklawnia cerclae TaxID=349934 RepID=A0ABX0SEH1_9ACTN|nr:NAD-dependent epimerase/dehydratase family protein [Brooklawnia cerclae]NIH56780.1 dihydroflavonol-4-reductase [Brooklawnia cerclae]
MPEQDQQPPLYLVTGVAGNLGSSVAARLLADGQDVRGLVLPGDPAADRVPDQVSLHTGDVTDTVSLQRFFAAESGRELVVIHTAAIVTVDGGFSQKVHDVNVTGTQNIIDACLTHNVRKLVYVGSTGGILETPFGVPITEPDRFDPDAVVGYYGWTKATASQLVLDAVRNQGLDATLVYPTGIAGPDDYAFGPVTSFIIDYCDGKMKAGIEGSFNAVDVRDLADATVAAVERGRTGEGYILGNECVSMEEMFRVLSDLTGTPQVTTILPAGAGKVLGHVSDLIGRVLGKNLRMTSFAVYNLTRNNLFDSSKARRELGFQTRPFGDTLADTIDWLEREGRVITRAA